MDCTPLSQQFAQPCETWDCMCSLVLWAQNLGQPQHCLSRIAHPTLLSGLPHAGIAFTSLNRLKNFYLLLLKRVSVYVLLPCSPVLCISCSYSTLLIRHPKPCLTFYRLLWVEEHTPGWHHFEFNNVVNYIKCSAWFISCLSKSFFLLVLRGGTKHCCSWTQPERRIILERVKLTEVVGPVSFALLWALCSVLTKNTSRLTDCSMCCQFWTSDLVVWR